MFFFLYSLGEWFCQVCEPTETDEDNDIIIEYDKVRILREGNKNLKKTLVDLMNLPYFRE